MVAVTARIALSHWSRPTGPDNNDDVNSPKNCETLYTGCRRSYHPPVTRRLSVISGSVLLSKRDNYTVSSLPGWFFVELNFRYSRVSRRCWASSPHPPERSYDNHFPLFRPSYTQIIHSLSMVVYFWSADKSRMSIRVVAFRCCNTGVQQSNAVRDADVYATDVVQNVQRPRKARADVSRRIRTLTYALGVSTSRWRPVPARVVQFTNETFFSFTRNDQTQAAR